VNPVRRTTMINRTTRLIPVLLVPLILVGCTSTSTFTADEPGSTCQ